MGSRAGLCSGCCEVDAAAPPLLLPPAAALEHRLLGHDAAWPRCRLRPFHRLSRLLLHHGSEPSRTYANGRMVLHGPARGTTAAPTSPTGALQTLVAFGLGPEHATQANQRFRATVRTPAWLCFTRRVKSRRPSDTRRASGSRLLHKALHNMKITLPQETPGKLAQFFGERSRSRRIPRPVPGLSGPLGSIVLPSRGPVRRHRVIVLGISILPRYGEGFRPAAFAVFLLHVANRSCLLRRTTETLNLVQG